MNIREFAKLCGVAHSTVSRVMNLPLEKSHAGKETYDRIRAKAAEVGFQINYYAQVFHSKSSNCLGFIAGNRMPLLTEPLLDGISRVLNLQKKHFAIHLCDNTQKAEATAFAKMRLYDTEAVFYTPLLQKGKNYSNRHICKVLEKYPEYPPVIAPFGGTDIAEFYQIRFHDYETGRSAALRQLDCGCRKFGIIALLYSNLMNREMIRGYRETLLENGIPAKDVRDVFIWEQGIPADDCMRLKDVQGLWVSHYVAFLHCARQLIALVGDSRRLHVDCLCGIETKKMFLHLQPMPFPGEVSVDFPNWFGSLAIHEFNLEDIGAKSAEITLQLSQPGAETVPKITYVDLTPVAFGGRG